MNQPKVIDILDEDFEVPVMTAELGELIEASIPIYLDIIPCAKTRRDYRGKLNELISEYNERRGMTIYPKQ